MAIYNISALQTSKGIADVMSFANSVTSGLFVGLGVTAFFFIMLLVLKRFEFMTALLAASWGTFIISIFFVFAGLLSFYWSLAFLIVVALASFISIIRGY